MTLHTANCAARACMSTAVEGTDTESLAAAQLQLASLSLMDWESDGEHPKQASDAVVP